MNELPPDDYVILGREPRPGDTDDPKRPYFDRNEVIKWYQKINKGQEFPIVDESSIDEDEVVGLITMYCLGEDDTQTARFNTAEILVELLRGMKSYQIQRDFEQAGRTVSIGHIQGLYNNAAKEIRQIYAAGKFAPPSRGTMVTEKSANQPERTTTPTNLITRRYHRLLGLDVEQARGFFELLTSRRIDPLSEEQSRVLQMIKALLPQLEDKNLTNEEAVCLEKFVTYRMSVERQVRQTRRTQAYPYERRKIETVLLSALNKVAAAIERQPHYPYDDVSPDSE